MKRWNVEKGVYEPYSVPKEWHCQAFETDMNKIINCARCGKEIPFGDSYASRQIHTDYGLAYSVCRTCYEKEYEEERASRC